MAREKVESTWSTFQEVIGGRYIMGFLSVLSFAHQLISQRVHPGDAVIDATLGNGVDTLFLSKLVGKRGAVYGFDIQQQAIDQTRLRLNKEQQAPTANIQLNLCSHAVMESVIPVEKHGSIAAVTFNLGYLPGADPTTITTEASTLPALEAALRLLRKGGIITIVLYRGHAGGEQEADAVERWASALTPGSYQTMLYQFTNSTNFPPCLLAVEKQTESGEIH